ncbi:unnamed protein product [Brassicogethes aeneus]|uniref:DUF659 domain-containing protein n=1 Tax=Brassicogethes aeneus TaxID=1431903 RepID=A0A9P0B093_BRAAE|nr:unnamed protein product [Brassicogethes aeneus]
MSPAGICSCKSLKGMRLNVPRAIRVGHSVTLGCEYDLEEAPLYSVKWYRDGDEFYRYVPKEAPPTRVFTLSGLHVDVSIVTDNAAAMKGSWAIIQETYPHILAYGCLAHGLNLLAKDFAKIPTVKMVINSAKDIVKFFNNKHLPKGVVKPKKH